MSRNRTRRARRSKSPRARKGALPGRRRLTRVTAPPPPRHPPPRAGDVGDAEGELRHGPAASGRVAEGHPPRCRCRWRSGVTCVLGGHTRKDRARGHPRCRDSAVGGNLRHRRPQAAGSRSRPPALPVQRGRRNLASSPAASSRVALEATRGAGTGRSEETCVIAGRKQQGRAQGHPRCRCRAFSARRIAPSTKRWSAAAPKDINCALSATRSHTGPTASCTARNESGSAPVHSAA